MPYFRHGDASLYYEESGKGAPLLFLHGASLDLRQWSAQMSHFSSLYRVIAMDARAHGKSSLPEGKVSPDVFWRDVIALMDHLEIQKATICGSSMGGHVAIQTAIYAPTRVRSLILIGAICSNRYNLFERIAVPINRFFMKHMSMGLISWSMCLAFDSKNPEIKRYIKDAAGSLRHDTFYQVWLAVTSMESRPLLSSIRCPALILIGDRDRLTRRQQPFIHGQISGSRLVEIQHAHHITNLDKPEQVEKEIDAFLRQLPRESSFL